MAEMVSFFISTFFVIMIMIYLMMMTGLVRLLERTLQPYLLLEKKETPS